MTFSVALATFNGGLYLREQLQSLEKQVVHPAELVVCDDGSTDDTLAILEAFARRAPFDVRVERNANRLGASGNFLCAAQRCRHSWIAYCDQDDVWLPGKLAAVQAAIARRPEALLVAHRASLVDEQLRPLGGLLHVPPVRRFTVVPRLAQGFWQYPYGFTMTFHSRLLQAVPVAGRPVESHDRWVAILAGIMGETVYLPEALALYRRHGRNVSELHDQPTALQTLNAQGLDGEYRRAAHLLEEVAAHVSRAACGAQRQEDGVRLAEAVRVFERQAAFLARRAEVSRPGVRLGQRLGVYLQLLAQGGYAAHRAGGLGLRAAVRDAARLALRERA